MKSARFCVVQTMVVSALLSIPAAPAFADCSSRTVEEYQRKLGVGIESINYQQIETYGQLAANQFAQCTTGLTGNDQLDSELAQARVLVITARAYLRDHVAGNKNKGASMLRDAVHMAKQVEAASSASDSQRAQATEVVSDASRFQSG